MMLQAMLNAAEEIPGVRVLATTIYHDGQKTAAVVLVGCAWDDVGNLILVPTENVGNVGNVGNGE